MGSCASSRRFGEAFTPETDPARVVVIFAHGHLFDYTLMDAVVALTAQYKARDKSIEFHRLHTRSVKMIKKAHILTKEVAYRRDNARIR